MASTDGGGGGASSSMDTVSTTSIDDLPDSVISLIISKLVDARRIAQAGTVCRRWQGCIPGITTLHFPGISCCPSDDDEDDHCSSRNSFSSSSSSSCSDNCSCHNWDCTPGRHSISKVTQQFTRFLLACPALQELSVKGTRWDNSKARTLLEQWLDALPQCMENFSLDGKFDFTLGRLSHCTKLSRLSLSDSSSRRSISTIQVQPGCQPFTMVRTCVLKSLQMDDAKLMLVVELLPSLEDLTVDDIRGLVSPCINTPNLTRLQAGSRSIGEYYDVDDPDVNMPIKCLTINAPKLNFLMVTGADEVHADGGPALLELVAGSYFVPVFRKKTINLQSIKVERHGWSMKRMIEFLGLASVRTQKLVLDAQFLHASHDESRKVNFAELFAEFSDLEVLDLGRDVYEYLQTAEAVEGANIGLRPVLKEVTVTTDHGNKKGLLLLENVLRNAPCLSTLKLYFAERPSGSFTTALLKLQAKYNQAVVELHTIDSSDESDSGMDYISDEPDEWATDFEHDEDDHVEDDSEDDNTSDDSGPSF